MKKYLLSILLILSTKSIAGTTQKTSSFTIKRPLKNIINSIVDYENFCEKDCKYKISSVKEIKIIKNHNFSSKSFYIWTHVESVLDSKYFSHVEVKEKGDSVLITQNQVSEEVAKLLEKKSGLSHSPLLEKISSQYELSNYKNEVQINYTIDVGYSGFVLNMAKEQIGSSIEESINEIKRNIASTSEE